MATAGDIRLKIRRGIAPLFVGAFILSGCTDVPPAVDQAPPRSVESQQIRLVDQFLAEDAAMGSDRGPRPERLLPRVSTTSGGDFDFLVDHIRSYPLRFDPCQPIRWVIDPTNEPAGARQLLFDAFDEAQQLSGLMFVFDGETDEPFEKPRDARNLDGGDELWKPVIVRYLDSDQFNISAGKHLAVDSYEGLALPDYAHTTETPTRPLIITGEIEFNRDTTDKFTEDGNVEELRWLFLHEIAHLIGLDHVDRPSSLLYGEGSFARNTLIPGDVHAFAVAGSATCPYPEHRPRHEDWTPWGE
jgi:hypothetical protein